MQLLLWTVTLSRGICHQPPPFAGMVLWSNCSASVQIKAWAAVDLAIATIVRLRTRISGDTQRTDSLSRFEVGAKVIGERVTGNDGAYHGIANNGAAALVGPNPTVIEGEIPHSVHYHAYIAIGINILADVAGIGNIGYLIDKPMPLVVPVFVAKG